MPLRNKKQKSKCFTLEAGGHQNTVRFPIWSKGPPCIRSIPYGCGEIVEVHDERHLESEDSEYRNKIYCLLQLACNSTLRNYEINAVSSIHDLQYGFLVNQVCLHGSEG